MIQHVPDETNETNWPNLRHDVRQYMYRVMRLAEKWTPGMRPYGRPDLSCPLSNLWN